MVLEVNGKAPQQIFVNADTRESTVNLNPLMMRAMKTD